MRRTDQDKLDATKTQRELRFLLFALTHTDHRGVLVWDDTGEPLNLDEVEPAGLPYTEAQRHACEN